MYSGKELRNPAELQISGRNNIDKILPKLHNVFFIKRFTLSLDTILIVLLKLTIFRKSGWAYAHAASPVPPPMAYGNVEADVDDTFPDPQPRSFLSSFVESIWW